MVHPHLHVLPTPRIQRGSVLLMTLVYTIMFGALASAMAAFAISNMNLGRAETQYNRALTAAESGMAYGLMQLRVIGLPIINEGSIAKMSDPTKLWYGTKIESLTGNSNNANNNGIAVQLASAINQCGSFAKSGVSVTAPTSLTNLTTPAIAIDSSNEDSTFQLTYSWNSSKSYLDSSQPVSWIVLTITSTGTSGSVSRTVSMDVVIQKTLKYAVYSNVAIQLGKNVRVVGDVASAYNGTSKGPPIQMFSDFHNIPNQSGIDSDLAKLRTLLNSYNASSLDNRLDVRNPKSDAAIAARTAGLTDRNGDGYIDDYDVAMLHLDTNYSSTNPTASALSAGEFTNPNTGTSYDADLWTLIDAPLGALNPYNNAQLLDGTNKPWAGYSDNQIDNQDSYAKVSGVIKMAISQSQWDSAASGWSAWGDSGGTRFQDLIEGSIVPTDPTTVSPVQFGVNFTNELTLTPQSFDTSAFDQAIPNTNATIVRDPVTKAVISISDGTLSLAMVQTLLADSKSKIVNSSAEHFPPDVSSGWQATYIRPTFSNVTFSNVRIAPGINGKFSSCTFNGNTHIKMTTKIVAKTAKLNTNPDGTTPNPDGGKEWAQSMISGTFNANNAITPTNSHGAAEGNNLRFSDCTFNGTVTADTPSAYTHFANSMTFDGNTVISPPTNTNVTIEAPNTNIEMGGYTNPGQNPSHLVGVVVAGNIDIRGTATVDGNLIVTGNGATNTTLGYFGTTDSGQAVPTISQLPSEATGKYGHLFFRYNPNRGMPNGIKIPLSATPQYSSYTIQ